MFVGHLAISVSPPQTGAAVLVTGGQMTTCCVFGAPAPVPGRPTPTKTQGGGETQREKNKKKVAGRVRRAEKSLKCQKGTRSVSSPPASARGSNPRPPSLLDGQSPTRPRPPCLFLFFVFFCFVYCVFSLLCFCFVCFVRIF